MIRDKLVRDYSVKEVPNLRELWFEQDKIAKINLVMNTGVEFASSYRRLLREWYHKSSMVYFERVVIYRDPFHSHFGKLTRTQKPFLLHSNK